MTKSEVALKMMELISKNAGNYKIECSDTGVFYITINKDIISFTDTELIVDTSLSFIRISHTDIYSINIHDTYCVIHLMNGAYLLKYKGDK